MKSIEAEADLDSAMKVLRREWTDRLSDCRESVARLEASVAALPSEQAPVFIPSEVEVQPPREVRTVSVAVEAGSPYLQPRGATPPQGQRRSPTPPTVQRRTPTPPQSQPRVPTPPQTMKVVDSPPPQLPPPLSVVTTLQPVVAVPLSLPGPLSQIPEEPDLFLEETLRDFDSRLLTLERFFADMSRRSPRKAPSTLSKDSVLDDPPAPDFAEELKANHTAMLAELEGLRGMYDQAVAATQAEVQDDPSPVQDRDILLDVVSRVGRLEEAVTRLQGSCRGEGDLREQIADLHTVMVRRSEVEAWGQDTERLKMLFATVSEELQDVEKSLAELQAKESAVPQAENGRMVTIQTAARRISQSFLHKNLLADVSALVAKDRSAPRVPIPAAIDPSPMLEKQIQGLAHDLEKVKTLAAGKYKEMDEFEQHLERQERILQDAMKRLQGEVTHKLEAFHSLLIKDADDPDSSKNLASLRALIMKLQKDFRDLHSTVEKLSPSLPDLPPSEQDDPSRTKYLSMLVQRHEATLRTQTVTIKTMADDLDTLQTAIRRQMEIQTSARLGEMEEFKGEIAAVMKKVEDGSKLSQKDMEKLNELYDKVESKGDKVEVAQKVDRTELKKAYSALSKKIEQYRETVKRAPEQTGLAKDEPAATTRKIEVGCLSCGHELSPQPVRELRLVTQSSDRRLNRFGHGFSKLLPMLNALTAKDRHLRVLYEAVTHTNSSVEKVRHVRLKTNESERGLSTTRRQSTSTTPNRG